MNLRVTKGGPSVKSTTIDIDIVYGKQSHSMHAPIETNFEQNFGTISRVEYSRHPQWESRNPMSSPLDNSRERSRNSLNIKTQQIMITKQIHNDENRNIRRQNREIYMTVLYSI